jgi:CheY-like chemotaxis protein
MSLSESSSLQILYAEDDAIISADTVDALEEAGFSVALARQGTEAIATLTELSTSLAALVTDVNLGSGPSGWELAHRAREMNPAIPVVYTSGETEAAWASNGVPNSVFIAKPFVSAQVVVALSNLLNKVGTEAH